MKLASIQFPVFNPYLTSTIEIYVSGCNRNCNGCCNSEIQSFEVGDTLDFDKLNTYLFERKDMFNAISFLGGDLLCQDEKEAYNLVFELFNRYNDKIFILFTGAEYDEIPLWVWGLFDVVKYGRFDMSKAYDLKGNYFPSTSNQQLYYSNRYKTNNYPRLERRGE